LAVRRLERDLEDGNLTGLEPSLYLPLDHTLPCVPDDYYVQRISWRVRVFLHNRIASSGNFRLFSFPAELRDLLRYLAIIHCFLGNITLRTPIRAYDFPGDNGPCLTGTERLVQSHISCFLGDSGARFNGGVFAMGMGFLIQTLLHQIFRDLWNVFS
jgi:hypothetical protein